MPFLETAGGAALISGLGGLLSGFFGGKAREDMSDKEYEQALKLQKAMLELQRKYQLEDRDWKMGQMEPYKPKTPYYEGYKDLPGMDEMMKKFVLGRMQDIFGDNLSRYGIDIGGLTAGLGQQQDQAGTTPMDEVVQRRGLGPAPSHRPMLDRWDRRDRRGRRDRYGEE
jgi:hypothetical protein